MELREYYTELIEKLLDDKQISGNKISEEFFSYYTSRLVNTDEIIGEPKYLYFEMYLPQGRCQINGYSFNEHDGILSLYIIPPISDETLESLDKEKASKYLNYLSNFIKKIDKIVDESEESTEGYDLAYDIYHRSSQKESEYYNLVGIKLVILTEKVRVNSLDTIEISEFQGLTITKQIYDLNTLKQLDESYNGKKDLKITFSNEIIGIKASESTDYESYLCSISGLTLARLYNLHGSRLIEGNIRSFLQTRGKVNKGIRATILKEPERFFAYNNGITATCTNLEISNGVVSEITNLQIVNGGQTTASLANVLLNDKAENQLRQIFVPMKLNLVSNYNVADELIPQISRYANSQNKVSEIDLASNHPFHRRIEEFSRKINTPMRDGYNYGTHWFYERASGQYAQETYKMSKTIKKNFEKINPKTQMFKKSDFAKYHNIFDLRPDIASKGGAAAFKSFSEWIISTWNKNDGIIDEAYFKEQVSNIIIFQKVDKLVKISPWYNGYKANINAYSISYLYWWLNSKDKIIDYSKIWKEQDISESLTKIFILVTKKVNEHLTNPDRPIGNVTEWAKRKQCWDDLKEKIIIPENYDFRNSVLNKEEIFIDKKDGFMLKENKLFSLIFKEPAIYKEFHEILLNNSNFSAEDFQLIEKIKLENKRKVSVEDGKKFNIIIEKYAKINRIFEIWLKKHL
ncbi:AIPR family protein [Lactococcus lactis]|uniref:AIPR family protein n=1 Tax=Lactococcus lactis TaxID=1358 RepID=UPI0024A99E05|nr:AIPR family protein [Lactococcus lactis]